MKKINEEQAMKRIAYEVSVSKLELLDDMHTAHTMHDFDNANTENERELRTYQVLTT